MLKLNKKGNSDIAGNNNLVNFYIPLFFQDGNPYDSAIQWKLSTEQFVLTRINRQDKKENRQHVRLWFITYIPYGRGLIRPKWVCEFSDVLEQLFDWEESLQEFPHYLPFSSYFHWTAESNGLTFFISLWLLSKFLRLYE